MQRFLVLTSSLMLAAMLCMSAISTVTAIVQTNGIITYLEEHIQTNAGTWCWRGICPNRTVFSQAKLKAQVSNENILRDLNANIWVELESETYLNFYSLNGNETSPITVITIDFRPQSVTLGEICRLFGSPTVIRQDAENNPVWHRSVCFEGGLCAFFEGNKSEISPFMSVTGLSIYGPNEVSASTRYRPWTGFVALPFH